MPLRGAYTCVPVTPQGNPVYAADPCLSVDVHRVLCSVNGNLFSYLVYKPTLLHKYEPSVSAIGNHYPWRLTLANGLTCSWDWWGHIRGRWLCAPKSGGGVLVVPMINGKLVGHGDDPLKFNRLFTVSFPNVYYAAKLDQGQQSTWTVLLGVKPGEYQRVNVAQAWY
jgi:hypothetical protein